MPASKLTDAERAAASTAAALTLAIRSDFKIACQVMKDHAETVQHVRNLLTNMHYWPGSTPSPQLSPTSSTPTQKMPPTKTPPTPKPTSSSKPSSSSPSSLVLAVQPQQVKALVAHTPVGPGGGGGSDDEESAAEEIVSKRRKAVAMSVAVVGSAALGDKPRQKGIGVVPVPDMIHRNFVTWGMVGTNVLKFILAVVQPVVCSRHNMKALCVPPQREPSRDAIWQLFEFFCKQEQDSPVGHTRKVQALADGFQQRLIMCGNYGGDLKFPPNWAADGWYKVTVCLMSIEMRMLTSTHVAELSLKVPPGGFQDGYPRIQANYSQHRACLVLCPEQTEQLFCTNLFGQSAKAMFLKRLGVGHGGGAGSPKRSKTTLAITDRSGPDAIPRARPSAAPLTAAVTTPPTPTSSACPTPLSFSMPWATTPTSVSDSGAGATGPTAAGASGPGTPLAPWATGPTAAVASTHGSTPLPGTPRAPFALVLRGKVRDSEQSDDDHKFPDSCREMMDDEGDRLVEHIAAQMGIELADEEADTVAADGIRVDNDTVIEGDEDDEDDEGEGDPPAPEA